MQCGENSEYNRVASRIGHPFKMEEEEKPRPEPPPERRIIREDRDSPNPSVPKIEPIEPWPEPGKPEKQ